MVYSFELLKHANIRYRDALSVLARCELFSMLSSLDISSEITEEEMGGSRFLSFECRELTDQELSFLSGHSSVVFLAEKKDNLLRPLPVRNVSYLPEDLPEDHGLQSEHLGEPVAGSGLPGTGRTADGYPHATSSPFSASIFARWFLNWNALTTLMMI